jgi:ribose transport system substrate-binding protein
MAGRSKKALKAAFSNIGLQVSWCAQGKQAAEYWGKLFNVDVTWFDGELSDAKQCVAIEDMANQKWDFVAIQPFSIDTFPPSCHLINDVISWRRSVQLYP